MGSLISCHIIVSDLQAIKTVEGENRRGRERGGVGGGVGGLIGGQRDSIRRGGSSLRRSGERSPENPFSDASGPFSFFFL